MDAINTPTPAIESPARFATLPAENIPQQQSVMTAPVDNGNDFMEKLSNINPVELGFGVLLSITLYYLIYVYRYKVADMKAFQTSAQSQIDTLTAEVATLKSEVDSSSSKTASMLGVPSVFI